MSRSTFNGPVLVGSDDAPTFTSGVDVDGTTVAGPNWGFANMSQSAEIEETTGQLFTGIVIPYSSVLTSVEVLVTTAWSGTNTYLNVGQSYGVVPAVGEQATGPGDSNEFVSGLLVNAVGNIKVGIANTALFHNALSCTTINTNTTVTTADTSILTVGQLICDNNNLTPPVNIPLQTTIVSIDTPTTFTISAAAIDSSTANFDVIGIDAGDIASWMNVGSRAASGPSAADELIDRMIVYDTIGTSTGAGRAVLTINYCQAVDLSAIA